MSDHAPSQTPRLDRDTIKAKQAHLSAMDRELTQRLASLYSTGKSANAPDLSDRDRGVHETARRLLNGAGHLLADLPSTASEGDLYAQRQAVRLAFDVLQKADAELEEQDNKAWIEAHRAEWEKLARTWILTAEALRGVEEAAQRFLSTAPGGFPGTGWIGWGVEIAPLVSNLMTPTLTDIIDRALAEGLVSPGDLRKARRSEFRA